jgi:hypothetical protein
MEYQQDFLGVDLEARGEKWQILQARTTPEEKRDIFLHCKLVLKLPYSVVTRLIWRRIIANYRVMPQIRRDDVMKEIEQASEDVLMYLPVIAKQRQRHPREF